MQGVKPNEAKPRLEKEVEDALRFARMEQAVADLAEAQKKSAESVQELLDAWKSSKWILGFIKTSAGLGVVVFSLISAWKKFWG